MDRLISITIGRNYGSKGREIGELLSKRLGFSFYDKELILMAAKESGVDVEYLDKADEKLINSFLDPYANNLSLRGSINDILFRSQEQIIQNIASKENCIIVGRMADYILRENPDCIKVFIYAPLEVRIETISQKYNLQKNQAKKLINSMDKQRGHHYKYFSNYKWDQIETKNVMLDSSLLGVEGAVDVLEKIVRLKQESFKNN
ncbi:cytidylate kinase [Acetitomaculum ruminis DSM 5522]|uniref:Cytidylate kinase n=1 Tax=Acetitomaculum ruminis DSM 5522 TaxID=1120918 RepID=A0A1I0VWK3_9FIRM|nr:cytidylate kinase-like family protein [Acetitomaculum ruminis]SFA80046.1 cytidylate kinase [Acetitomaculum ruminis DSM 5522]